MKTLPKSAKIIRYLKNAFDAADNAIIIHELMPRLENQEGIAHLLVDCEIPPNVAGATREKNYAYDTLGRLVWTDDVPNHELEWGGISNSREVMVVLSQWQKNSICFIRKPLIILNIS